MKKTISLVITSALVGSVVLSGCNAKDIINNIPTKATETTAPTTEGTTTPTETIAVENTYETIATTNPPTPDENAFNFLYNFGYTKNDFRKKYTFDTNDLNREENRLYVLDRMCNSVDYITTLQATYTSTVNNKTTLVTYAIDRRVGKAKEILYNISKNENKCTPTRYVYVDGDYHVKLLPDDNIREKYTFYTDESDKTTLENISETIGKPIADEFEKEIKANSNTSAFSDNIFDYIQYIDVPQRKGVLETPNEDMPLMIRRSDGNIGLITAPDQYLPQNFAFDVLFKNNDWKIDGVENYKTNEVICISGKYKDPYYEYVRTFDLRIDKNTGILLSCNEYNTSGNLVEEWKTEQFILNADIDENIFDKIDPKDIVDSKQQ